VLKRTRATSGVCSSVVSFPGWGALHSFTYSQRAVKNPGVVKVEKGSHGPIILKTRPERQYGNSMIFVRILVGGVDEKRVLKKYLSKALS
jgi:hypothetical protein